MTKTSLRLHSKKTQDCVGREEEKNQLQNHGMHTHTLLQEDQKQHQLQKQQLREGLHRRTSRTELRGRSRVSPLGEGRGEAQERHVLSCEGANWSHTHNWKAIFKV